MYSKERSGRQHQIDITKINKPNREREKKIQNIRMKETKYFKIRGKTKK